MVKKDTIFKEKKLKQKNIKKPIQQSKKKKKEKEKN